MTAAVTEKGEQGCRFRMTNDFRDEKMIDLRDEQMIDLRDEEMIRYKCNEVKECGNLHLMYDA